MKILRIITRLNVGGPTVHVVLLSQYLKAYGYDTLLVHGSVQEGEEEMEWIFSDRGIKRVKIPEIGRAIRPLNDFKALRKLRDVIRSFKPDIVHTHQAKAGLIGRLAAKLENVPLVVHTYHGLNFEGHLSSLGSMLSIRAEQFMARLSTKIIAISSMVKRDIVKTYRVCRESKVKLIQLGVELEPYLSSNEKRTLFRKSLEDMYHFPPDKILIGFIGRLSSVKNPFLFLKVAQIICQRRDDVWFAVVGEGELQHLMMDQAKAIGISGRVIFLNDVKEMDALYGGLDMILLTSKSEGTPLTLIEGMASSKPVVATRVGGVPDIVQDRQSGYLAAPDDHCSLAERCLEIIERGEWINEKGRDFVVKNYSVHRLTSDIDSLYKELTRAS